MYLFGGWDGNKDLSDFWCYHIPTNKWKLLSIDTSADGGPSRRSCHKMVVDIINKHIFILGRYLERNLRDIPQNIKVCNFNSIAEGKLTPESLNPIKCNGMYL